MSPSTSPCSFCDKVYKLKQDSTKSKRQLKHEEQHRVEQEQADMIEFRRTMKALDENDLAGIQLGFINQLIKIEDPLAKPLALKDFPEPDFRGLIGDWIVQAPNGMWSIYEDKTSYFNNTIGLASEEELLTFIKQEYDSEGQQRLSKQIEDIKAGKHLEPDQKTLMTWDYALNEIKDNYGEAQVKQLIEFVNNLPITVI